MSVDPIFSSIDISAYGLSAQRKRMDAVAQNIANVDTTRTEEGGPYTRKMVAMRAEKGNVFLTMVERIQSKLKRTDPRHLPPSEVQIIREGPLQGRIQTDVVPDPRPPKLEYNPTHPDADENGYVKLPNINLVTEMVDMMTATRSYEANVTAISAAKELARRALEI